MLVRCKQIPRRVFQGSSRGFTLVEVMITLVILGFLVLSIPAALLAITNAQFRANEMRMAELLTRNEFEYVKGQDYIWGNMTYPVQYDLVPASTNFGFNVKAQPIDPETGQPNPTYQDGNVTLVQDDGIQLITVTVYGFGYRSGESGQKPLLVSTNYKVARGGNVPQ